MADKKRATIHDPKTHQQVVDEEQSRTFDLRALDEMVMRGIFGAPPAMVEADKLGPEAESKPVSDHHRVMGIDLSRPPDPKNWPHVTIDRDGTIRKRTTVPPEYHTVNGDSIRYEPAPDFDINKTLGLPNEKGINSRCFLVDQRQPAQWLLTELFDYLADLQDPEVRFDGKPACQEAFASALRGTEQQMFRGCVIQAYEVGLRFVEIMSDGIYFSEEP